MSKLNENQASRRKFAFVDYKPAELKILKDWLVVFYAKNPITNTMERHRVRVPKMNNKANRLKHGKLMVMEINRKLETGWLPIHDSIGTTNFKTIDDCLDIYLAHAEKEIRAGNKRTATVVSYRSYIRLMRQFMKEKRVKANYIIEVKNSFIVQYLDYIYIERNNSTTTFNNHLTWLKAFANFCLQRGFIKEDFTTGLKRKLKNEKKRQVLTPDVKEKLKALRVTSPEFFTVCMATYYCFLRNTEITKLRVRDIHLDKNYIVVEGEVSKNKKRQIITIPDAYHEVLKQHISKSKDVNDYVFSYNELLPAKEQATARQIRYHWSKFRKEYGVPEEYQFYSLKDTGITDLLLSGVPAIKVKEQARHSDITITEKYTHRNTKSDDVVKAAKFNF